MTNANDLQAPLNISRHASPDYAPQFGIYAGDSPNDLATVRGENAAAYAALFAAAPVMLAALEIAADRMESALEAIWGDDEPDADCSHTAGLVTVREAIAAAKVDAA